jgi:hypothetical protein
MDLTEILIIISIVIWIVVPIRQFSSKYFYFFLVIGATDLIVRLNRYFDLSLNNSIYVLMAFLLILSLLSKNERIRILPYYLGLALTIFFVLYFNSFYIVEFYMLIILNIFILVQIFLHFFNDILVNNEVKSFYVIFLLYQIITVAKLFNIITTTFGGYFYFIIASAFQIIIGLFFCFINIDKPNLVFKIPRA